MREQVDYLNRAVGWFRFSGEVLIRDIDGRAKAIEIEDAYINAYKKKHGRNPRGNLD
jgi:URI fold toxin 2